MENTPEVTPVQSKKLSVRNLLMFPLGTIGRDFLYNFFNNFLLSFVLLTKNLTNLQFASITGIIIAARIFDAFNDPIMGGIVENTRTKWGKYKPWQLLGAVLTAGVVIALFNVPLQGWGFIGFLAVVYFMFSITFTMNDISYWGMLPTLTSNSKDRDRLTSFLQIAVGIGAGLSGFAIPILTVGEIGSKVFGSAPVAFAWISVIAAALMILFQLFTILGVKEDPLPPISSKKPPLKFKDIFRTIFRNDQLLWYTLIMLIFSVGTNVVGGGLSTMYIYFEFGYDGMLTMLFGIGYGIVGTIFTLFYPKLSEKFTRDKVLYSTGICIIVGYLLMLIMGLSIPTGYGAFSIDVLGMHFNFTLKYFMMMLANTVLGWGGGFYMIIVINMANSVEYNEYKTGRREESLIFSLRPFTAKLGSALTQGLVSLVYLVAGVLTITNQISQLENSAASNAITAEQKDAAILEVIKGVPESSKIILLVCMCVIPIVFISVAMILYKKKTFLNEKNLALMAEEVAKRKQEEAAAAESEA